MDPNETPVPGFAEHRGTRLVAVDLGTAAEHDDAEVPVCVPQLMFRQIYFAHAGYPTLWSDSMIRPTSPGLGMASVMMSMERFVAIAALAH
jgi:hypothetical protein